MLQRPGDRERVLELGGRVGGVGPAQDLADLLDRIRGKLGDVGEGALPGLSALAVGLADQDRGPRVAVGDDIDEHGYLVSYEKLSMQGKISQYGEECMDTFCSRENGLSPPQSVAAEGKNEWRSFKIARNFRLERGQATKY